MSPKHMHSNSITMLMTIPSQQVIMTLNVFSQRSAESIKWFSKNDMLANPD